jgi:hypothetical protein
MWQSCGKHCDDFELVITEISPIHLDDLHGPSPLILSFSLGLFLLGLFLFWAMAILQPFSNLGVGHFTAFSAFFFGWSY